MTTVTARGPSAAALCLRSAELEREIDRLRAEQRSIAARLREVRPRRRAVWGPALAGALASALLAAPLVALVVREPPRPPLVVAAPPAPPAPVETSTPVSVIPAPELPLPEPVPIARVQNPAVPATREARASSVKGALTVVCLPKCEDILLDGKSIGPGHLFNVPAPAGRHVLSLSTGSVKKIFPIDIPPDATRDVRVYMGDDIPELRD